MVCAAGGHSNKGVVEAVAGDDVVAGNLRMCRSKLSASTLDEPRVVVRTLSIMSSQHTLCALILL